MEHPEAETPKMEHGSFEPQNDGGQRKLPAPRIRSDALFGDHDRIVIEHRGQDYLLLITRNGRLLLNRGAT